ncbi:DMT family transporter [Staphylococcus sp. KG4-3]|uniref:DMT family transporter n=2 Tax=Staphylococcus TaxID=1279 RepID=A0A418IKU7_STAXY|nr:MULTISPECIES: DMT family transporter [Staphylococcus]MDW8543626.1 DMT family transporter [Staphylococcus sp. KG4-1]MDW8563057.1 DMT family transporter [Staphylococcus sp. KG4-3]RIN08220.1 DMT family transporter [Staphylococcus xylosus]
MKFIFYILALIAGASLGIEAALGGLLSEEIGNLESTLYIFIMGSLVLILAIVFFGKGDLSKIPRQRTWQIGGGILGAIGMTLLFTSVTFIGVGISLTSVIIGQLLTGIVIDHLGLFGSPKYNIDRYRLIAVLLLFLSLYFIL